MDELLSLLKEKYRQMDNLMAFTKEMEKVISTNDLGALGAVLKMRRETMDRLDALNADISNAIEAMSPDSGGRARQLLGQSDEDAQPENTLETNIYDTNRITLQLLQRVITLDEAINKKIHRRA